MVDNPAEMVSISALVTTAFTAKGYKKQRWIYRKESLTINERKHMSISAKHFRAGEKMLLII